MDDYVYNNDLTNFLKHKYYMYTQSLECYAEQQRCVSIYMLLYDYT